MTAVTAAASFSLSPSGAGSSSPVLLADGPGSIEGGVRAGEGPGPELMLLMPVPAASAPASRSEEEESHKLQPANKPDHLCQCMAILSHLHDKAIQSCLAQAIMQ